MLGLSVFKTNAYSLWGFLPINLGISYHDQPMFSEDHLPLLVDPTGLALEHHHELGNTDLGHDGHMAWTCP